MMVLDVGDFGYDGPYLMAKVVGAINEEYILADDGTWVANDYHDNPAAPDWINEELNNRAQVFLLCAANEDYLIEHATKMLERYDEPPACGVERIIENFRSAVARATEIILETNDGEAA